MITIKLLIVNSAFLSISMIVLRSGVFEGRVCGGSCIYDAAGASSSAGNVTVSIGEDCHSITRTVKSPATETVV